MLIYVTVGRKVVAAGFETQTQALKFCVKNLAPGCGAVIKKTEYRGESVPGQKRNNNEARQRFRYMQPGEFTL